MHALNEFRACDAIEFVRALDWACGRAEAEIRARLRELADRTDAGEIPSHLLAAYRGYEAALNPPMMIVKLDDTL